MTANSEKPVEDVKPLSDEQKAKDFVKGYEALCEKYSLRIVTTPVWKVSQDTGDWRLVLQTSIGKLQQPK